MTKINIILASKRSDSQGHRLYEYIKNNQTDYEKANDIELGFIDLQDYDIPAYNQPMPPFNMEDYPAVLGDSDAHKWVDDVYDADGYLFLTPEYDFSVPGYAKNATDYLAGGVSNKPIQLITYSMGSGAGSKSGIAWLPVFHCLGMVLLPYTVAIPKIQNIYTEDGHFQPDASEKEQDHMKKKISDTIHNVGEYTKRLTK